MHIVDDGLAKLVHHGLQKRLVLGCRQLLEVRTRSLRGCVDPRHVAGANALGDQLPTRSQHGREMRKQRLMIVNPVEGRSRNGALETLHIVLIVRPFHRNIARALLKEPKVYFYDTGLVKGDDGIRFENACATMLQAEVQRRRDAEGQEATLSYIRDKEGREIDFVVCEADQPTQLVECDQARGVQILTDYRRAIADMIRVADPCHLYVVVDTDGQPQAKRLRAFQLSNPR